MIQPFTHLAQMALFAFAGLIMLLAFLVQFITREDEPHKYDLRGLKGRYVPPIEVAPAEESETERAAVEEWLPSPPVSPETGDSAPINSGIRPGELTRTTRTYFFEKPRYTGETTRAERRAHSHD
jgi:hypothetical protein